ncbi:MAG: glycosyltransferase N-terminal domain-containing protein [Elusimicrobiota bacterium]|nr:glycosyltransferase N-terminal domain-containing protein [Elusimicrobiota bacterium]
MLIVYNFLICILILLYTPFIISRILLKNSKNSDKSDHYVSRKELLERLGMLENIKKGKYILVHCASVGEVNLVRLFIQKLVKEFSEYKILLSVITPSGYALAVKLHLPVEHIFFLPIDFYFFIRKFFRKIHPEVLILVEAELWPNLIHVADKFNTKIILINGRISQRTFKFRYLLKAFLKTTLNKVDLYLMREQTDIERIITLGAEAKKSLLTGNMKYDLITDSQQIKSTKEQFGFSAGDKIFVAGSVREGEEELVIRTYLEVKNKFPEVKFIIAPRHLNRIATVESLLKNNNIPFIRKSSVTIYDSVAPTKSEACLPRLLDTTYDCLLIDTFGDLISAYQVADVVFVGGSLLPYGGHNIIEPTSLGKVVIFGPYISNFFQPAKMLLKNNAAIQVNSQKELKEVLIDFFDNPAKYQLFSSNAKNVIDNLKGATDRNVHYVKQVIYG